MAARCWTGPCVWKQKHFKSSVETEVESCNDLSPVLKHVTCQKHHAFWNAALLLCLLYCTAGCPLCCSLVHRVLKPVSLTGTLYRPLYWDSNSRHKYVLTQLSVWDGIQNHVQSSRTGECTYAHTSIEAYLKVWVCHWTDGEVSLAWNQNAPGMRNLMKSSLMDILLIHACLCFFGCLLVMGQCHGREADLAQGSSHFIWGRTRASLSASHASKHWAAFRFARTVSAGKPCSPL